MINIVLEGYNNIDAIITLGCVITMMKHIITIATFLSLTCLSDKYNVELVLPENIWYNLGNVRWTPAITYSKVRK